MFNGRVSLVEKVSEHAHLRSLLGTKGKQFKSAMALKHVVLLNGRLFLIVAELDTLALIL